SKSYQEGTETRLVLKDTCFQFQSGEFTAILGKSGSGKTTLLNLISGIDKADSGYIELNGENLTLLNDHERTLLRRKHIGFIFQFFNLIPTLSVWENVILPLELNQMTSVADFERASLLLSKVGLLDRRKNFPDQLSGGEQQRVSIARSLVHQPEILLADEPTGNLDEATGREVLRLLNRLTRATAKNFILVTHSPEAAAFADRQVYLADGKLVESTQKVIPHL
ncbi:MAG: ABC transporter ATP-binding protein, partial [Veillonellaceae bacterium]|nr:ABC transporter ATP-binding protein [Veillonellaceae bacterium]